MTDLFAVYCSGETEEEKEEKKKEKEKETLTRN